MIYHHSNPSDRWDKKEAKMDEADMASVDGEPEKEKINVVTESEEEEDKAPVFSGLFCVFCGDFAIHIYEGNSICHDCFHKEVGDLIRNKNKKNN